MTASPANIATIHDMNCPRRGRAHDDAAKRLADAHNLHLTAGGLAALGKIVAVSMEDGRGGEVLYDTRREAVRHARHDEARTVFIHIRPQSMSVCSAAALLFMQRQQFQRRMGLNDRDHRAGGRVVIPRLTVEDQLAQIRQLVYGTAPTNLVWPN